MDDKFGAGMHIIYLFFFLNQQPYTYLLIKYKKELVLLLSLVNTPGDAPDVWSWQDHHPPQSAASPAELSAGNFIAPKTTGNREGGWSGLDWRRAKNHLWVSACLLFFPRENNKSSPFTSSSGSHGNYFHSLYFEILYVCGLSWDFFSHSDK